MSIQSLRQRHLAAGAAAYLLMHWRAANSADLQRYERAALATGYLAGLGLSVVPVRPCGRCGISLPADHTCNPTPLDEGVRDVH